MTKDKLTFKEAVESTPDIATGYKTGLIALGQYSNKVSVRDTRLLGGSVDIDACTVAKYPDANRWDYALAYNHKVYFVEVHPAHTSQVSKMLEKLQWLKNWLIFNASEINKLKAEQPYYWIQSGGCDILKTSSQYRRIMQVNLKPVACLNL